MLTYEISCNPIQIKILSISIQTKDKYKDNDKYLSGKIIFNLNKQIFIQILLYSDKGNIIQFAIQSILAMK